MSITNVLSSMLETNTRVESRALSVTADDDFRAKLVLGDIIKGKVMRQYEQGKYGVVFQGKEQVVDSAIPLNVGEQLKAKVIGVNEKVHLQRLVQAEEQGRSFTQRHLDDLPKDLSELLLKFNITLTAKEVSLYQQVANTVRDTGRLALATALVKKMGLAINKTAVLAVYETINQNKMITAPVGAAITGTDSNSEHRNSELPINTLASTLAALVEGVIAKQFSHQALRKVDTERTPLNVDHKSHSNKASDDESNSKRLGEWLLNVQQGGAVNHRTFRMPIWFDDEMMEVDMALFSDPLSDESEQSTITSSLHSQKVMISISPPYLGKIDIELKLIKRHISLSFNSERKDTAELLSLHLTELSEVFRKHNWFIGYIKYKQQLNNDVVYQSIIEHQMSKESLMQLL